MLYSNYSFLQWTNGQKALHFIQLVRVLNEDEHQGGSFSTKKKNTLIDFNGCVVSIYIYTIYSDFND